SPRSASFAISSRSARPKPQERARVPDSRSVDASRPLEEQQPFQRCVMDTNNLKTLSLRYHPSVEVGKTSGFRSPPRASSVAIYIHIPFLATRCHFCSFAIVTGKLVNHDIMEDYLEALKKEITAYAATLKEQ